MSKLSVKKENQTNKVDTKLFKTLKITIIIFRRVNISLFQ